MADLESRKVSQRVIIVPETIDYPSIRQTMNSGLLEKGDWISTVTKVYGADGKLKWEAADKVTLKEFPDEKYEVFGVVSVGFNESPRDVK